MAHRGTLQVRRHIVRARVADGCSVRGVTASLGDALTDALSDGLAALPAAGGDGSVWLVRALDVRAAVSGTWPAGRIAATVATAALSALSTALERGADGRGVVWFPDRATYVGHFLVDLAHGRAAGRWEYGEFADLATWPCSAAAAGLARREPATALDALVGLSAADLRAVVGRLAPADTGAILVALSNGLGAGSAGVDPTELVVAAAGRLCDPSGLPPDERLAALALFLEVARAGGGPAPAGSAGRARDMAALAAVLTESGGDRSLATAVAEGDWRAVGIPRASRLATLASWPRPAREAAVRLLTATEPPPEEHRGDGRAPRLATGLGGMFLLLPLLDELPCEEGTAGWPDLDGVAPAVLLRYLAVIGMLGEERNGAALRDPVLRLALGIPGCVDGPRLGEWSAGLEQAGMADGRQAWVAALQRRAKLSGRVSLAPLGEGVVAVDGGRGIWLGTAPATPDAVRRLVESIDDAVGRPVAVAVDEPWIEACLDPDRPLVGAIDSRLLVRLDDQAAYAALGPPLELGPSVGEAALLATQALGRELAWRLSGFAGSSLPYLWENVLCFPASVSVESEQLEVALDDPPLHLVLTLAGMNRRRFRLPATGDREWVLTRPR